MTSALRQLDEGRALTRNQKIVLAVAMMNGALEFFDQFIIAFVLAFMIKPWHLTYGQSAVVLLSSGIGSIAGSFLWGHLADRVGRRITLIAILMCYSLASLLLAFTPEGNWAYLSVFRAGVGLGVGGYIVNIALVQEFVPACRRAWAGGIISIAAPGGLLIASLSAAALAPLIGWRGLFLLGALPALFAIVILRFLPESPRWALATGRVELARRSAGWALGLPPEAIDITAAPAPGAASWRELFRHRRSVATGSLVNLGAITGIYGLILWAPSLLVLVQGFSPVEASRVMVVVSLCNIGARIVFSTLAETIGRKRSGVLYCFGAAALLAITGLVAHGDIALAPLFWLFVLATFFLADGGFAVSGPYTTEIWPSRLRASGAGFSYGAGSLGKIFGPLGLALIIGSSNALAPEVTVARIVPAFLFLAGWYALAGLTYLFIGPETMGRSTAEIDAALAQDQAAPRLRARSLARG